jgi:hypothetical protein
MWRVALVVVLSCLASGSHAPASLYGRTASSKGLLYVAIIHAPARATGTLAHRRMHALKRSHVTIHTLAAVSVRRHMRC